MLFNWLHQIESLIQENYLNCCKKKKMKSHTILIFGSNILLQNWTANTDIMEINVLKIGSWAITLHKYY